MHNNVARATRPMRTAGISGGVGEGRSQDARCAFFSLMTHILLLLCVERDVMDIILLRTIVDLLKKRGLHLTVAHQMPESCRTFTVFSCSYEKEKLSESAELIATRVWEDLGGRPGVGGFVALTEFEDVGGSSVPAVRLPKANEMQFTHWRLTE